MSEPAPTAGHPPLRATPWLVAKLALATLVTVPLLVLATTPAERVAAAVLPALVAVGIVATHDLRPGHSRLPAVLQGLAGGVYVGITAGIWMLDGVAVELLGWGFAVAAFHPAILPARIRHAEWRRSPPAAGGTP